ncbi:MAG: hypothetical protein AAF206_01710, partial [Bacteroidota bacterium]
MDRVMYFLRDNLYGSVVSAMVRYRYMVVAFGIAIFMVTIGMMKGSYVGFGFFPFIIPIVTMKMAIPKATTI